MLLENLRSSAMITLPLGITIFLGIFLRKTKILRDDSMRALDQLSFYVLVPSIILANVLKADLSSVFQIDLLLFCVIASVVIFLVLFFLIPRIEKDPRKIGVMIQAILRANFLMYGFAITESIYGTRTNPPLVSMSIIVTPLLNAMAIVALEYYREKNVNIRSIVKNLFRNPTILCALFSVAVLLLKIKIPEVVLGVVTNFSNATTPICLLSLGASLTFQGISNVKRALIISVVGRLIIVPVLTIPLAGLLGFRNEELIVILVAFGAPTAVSSYAMSKKMGGDPDLSSGTIVFSTIASLITLFLWIFIFKTFNWI